MDRCVAARRRRSDRERTGFRDGFDCVASIRRFFEGIEQKSRDPSTGLVSGEACLVYSAAIRWVERTAGIRRTAYFKPSLRFT